MATSVLTIVRGRRDHLVNQAAGLRKSTVKPDEWIIVGMGEDAELDSYQDLPIHTARVEMNSPQLPLAEARNRAAALCQTESMIFLDVDCIPHPEMIEVFQDTLVQSGDRLWMGSPRYLPKGATANGIDFSAFDRAAVKHPSQPSLASGQRQSSSKYELFWSLCFAINQHAYDAIGGFDESFCGYGGEDTDFSFSARRATIGFGVVGAIAYHQHHKICKPPLNHFLAIIDNARRFHAKWGHWAMEGWLKQFEKLDLVNYDPVADNWEVIRTPSDQEIRNATAETPAGF